MGETVQEPIDSTEPDEMPVPIEAVKIERAYSFLVEKLGTLTADELIPHVVELMIAKAYGG